MNCKLNFCNEPSKNLIYMLCQKHCLNIRCSDALCDEKPCFNDLGQTKSMYCPKHKLNGMINVEMNIRDNRCQQPDCENKPIYNYFHNLTGILCDQHKLDEMVDITLMMPLSL